MSVDVDSFVYIRPLYAIPFVFFLWEIVAFQYGFQVSDPFDGFLSWSVILPPC